MDAITFFKEKQRMTKECTIECCKCPLSYENNEEGLACSILERYYPEKAVEIIENWSKKHPIKTRQSEFLKLYPKADLEDGILVIRPCELDSDMECFEGDQMCYSCKKRYWLEEIGGDE